MPESFGCSQSLEMTSMLLSHGSQFWINFPILQASASETARFLIPKM